MTKFVHMQKPGEAMTIQQYKLEMQNRTRNITDGRWLRQPSRGPVPLDQAPHSKRRPSKAELQKLMADEGNAH